MITLHHLEYSQSFRILWLLEELGMEYDLKIYERDPETRLAPPEYKALSPLTSAPVITDGDLVLAESNAIIDYILDKAGDNDLRPAPDSVERMPYLFWFHTAQGSMMPMLLMDLILRMMSERSPFFLRPIMRAVVKVARGSLVEPRMAALIKQAELDLGMRKWLAGETLTAADITMSYSMGSAQLNGHITDAHPHCQRWLKQMEESESFQRALAKDGRATMLFTS